MEEFIPILQGVKDVKIDNKYIPDEEVGCYFDGPNVVIVLPYLDATQSGVIPIAIEYGTPIIASNTGGLKEQMMDGEFGLLVETGNVEDLYLKMKEIMSNKSLYTEQQNKMKNAIAELEWDVVIKRVLDVID